MLVQFQDKGTSAIVPIKQLKGKDCLKIGDECEVMWSDKKMYIRDWWFFQVLVLVIRHTMVGFLMVILLILQVLWKTVQQNKKNWILLRVKVNIKVIKLKRTSQR